MPYVVKEQNLGGGTRSFVMRSRKRARKRRAKRHEHLVLWTPAERVLLCSCRSFNFRGWCSATLWVLAMRAR